MRKRLTKLSALFIFLLLISTPFTAGATSDEISSSSDHSEAQYITLLEDLPIIVDDQEIGVLRAGAELYLHDSEGRKSIVLGTQEIILAEDIQYDEVENDGSSYISYGEEEYSSESLEKTTIFADSEFTKELAEITGNEQYLILAETEEYYEVIIGNVKGYIQKEVEAVEQTAADDVIVSNPEQESSEKVEDPEPTTIKADQNSQSEAPKVTVSQFTNPNYFMITDESLSVYDNSTGKLVKVGALVSDQVYPKVQTAGNWIKIKYGNGYGYVWKESTVDGDPSNLKNVNSGLKNNGLKLTSNKYLSVYDNTSGKLVQFGSIQPNTEYPIISEAGNWYKIDFSGRIGYVYKPAAQLVFTGKEKYFKVKTEFLSIYDNRSGSLKKVGSLIQNQEFPIVNISGNWIKIKYLGTNGYIWKDSVEPSSGSSIKNANKGLKTSSRKVVSNGYLSVYDNTSGSLVHFASIDPNVEYSIIETTGNWHKIDVSGRIGYIYKPATRYVFNHTDKYFKVTEDELPVYDNRTGTLVEVGKLKKDQVFQRISDAGNWHKIQYGSIDGYVRKNSTDVAGKTAAASNPVISSKDNFMALQDLSVYDNSTGKLIPFATITKDQIYPFIGESGNWMEIQMAGRKGFVYKSGVRKGPTINYVNYNRSLNEVVQLQMKKNPQTDKDYRTYVRADALKVDNKENPTKGTALGSEWNVRGGAGDQHWVIGQLKDKEKVDIIGKVSNKEDGYDWYEIKYNRTWVNASPYDIGYYVNPDQFPSATKGYYQFLKLSGSAQIFAKEVNDKILKDKGILSGKGDTFIKAGLTNKINEIYLISHALLETGNGKSTLASGVKVKQKRDSYGNLIYVHVAGEKLVDIEILDSSATNYDAVVYNMFGIQAFDSNPNLGGARKAYNEGWTTPEKAIIGGGNIIAQNYIYQGQDTLYKMRWNPDRPGTHQYATDVAWAVKQTNRMYDLYRMIDHYYQVFEIPKYK